MTDQQPDCINKLSALKQTLSTRANVIKSIRSFFWENGFIETETPLVVDAPAPEEYIEAPVTENGFLRTSPELQMKQMITAGYEKIFQIGPCFREGEIGKLHCEEFTMLEWYESHINYLQLYEFTKRMLTETALSIIPSGICEFRNHKIDFTADWDIITVHQAFAKFAKHDLDQAIKDDNFEEILVDKVEPFLGLERPALLIDYPAKLAALSRRKQSAPHLAERWELYLGGIEIANAYSELTDAQEQRERFATFAETRKQTGYRPYPEAKDFLAALDYGMPNCAGCALGIDRLIMILTDANTIEDVIYPDTGRLKKD